jgi:hypothetical protein
MAYKLQKDQEMRRCASFPFLTVFVLAFGSGCHSTELSEPTDAKQGGLGGGAGDTTESTTNLPEGGTHVVGGTYVGGGTNAGGGTHVVGGTNAGGGTHVGGGTNVGGGTENTCFSGTVSRDSISLEMVFPEAVDSYSVPPVPSTVKGDVIVARVDSQIATYNDGPVSRQTLYLVDETGQKLSLSAEASSLSFEGIKVGTQFWLDAYAIVIRSNPYAYHRSMRFSLRTEQNGPVVFASLQGTEEDGDVLLGVPLSVQSRCIATSVSHYGGISSVTGQACTQSNELFDVVLDTSEPIRIAPGTTKQVTVSENLYDLTLWSASNVTFSERPCTPADFAPSLELKFDVIAKSWQELVAQQPVTPEQLP